MRELSRRLLFLPACSVLAACGSRTALLVPLDDDAATPTPAPIPTGKPVTRPSAPEPAPEAGPDAAEASTTLPPVHLSPTQPPSPACADAGAALVFVISEEGTLSSFDPRIGVFTAIGTVVCPTVQVDATPFSMGVDQAGTAYVVFGDGELFRVSTATAACEATPFVAGQGGFSPTFGMGFARAAQGPADTLYLASTDEDDSRLGTLDPTTLSLAVVGPFSPALVDAELTGTGAGDLFAFYPLTDPDSGAQESAVGQIDKTTARVTGQSILAGVPLGTAWAFAFWGGDFYTFTAPSLGTLVTRLRPSDGSVVQVAQNPEKIVGAGVSTCAPQQ